MLDDCRIEFNTRLLLEHPAELVPTLVHEPPLLSSPDLKLSLMVLLFCACGDDIPELSSLEAVVMRSSFGLGSVPPRRILDILISSFNPPRRVFDI